jgi:hypothetical protein
VFDDVRTMMSRWHGEVETFTASAKSIQKMTVLHTILLAGAALHGIALEWRDALEMRDQLVSLTKASDRQTSETQIDGAKVSLAISIAGMPNFQIEAER